MKLYTDNQGNWVGTQAEFKNMIIYTQTNVPTDKPNLLKFLNEHRVGGANSDPSSPRNSFSQTEQTRLKAAYEHAGLAREYLRRVYKKVGEDEE